MRTRLLTIALLLAASVLVAGDRRLTIDDIYDSKKKIAFSGAPQSGFVWIDDAHFFWPRTTASGEVTAQLLVEAATGREVAMFDTDDLQAQVMKIEGVSEDDAKRIARPRAPRFNPRKDSILLTIRKDLYLYSIRSKTLTRLTSAEGEEEEAGFSPDGASVAFVRASDLYVVGVDGTNERRLTTDGGDQILNGKLDWLYQEEIYGRGTFKAWWWSPDSKSIAFLQLDERPVKEFTIVDHIPRRQEVETMEYPKAGDENPIVRLFVVPAAGGERREIRLDEWRAADPLVVAVSWSPDSREVLFQVQDREQTWLELIRANPATGAQKRVLREKTEAWVEPSPEPAWLGDGSFLWLSERDGYRHIYRVSADGATQTQITRGPWEVRTFHGVDTKQRLIYFSGTEKSSIESHVYRIRLDGTKLERLSQAAGTHTASFNPKLTLWIDSYSNVTTPPSVSLYSSAGKLVRVIDPNRAGVLDEFALSTPEFLQVKTRDGFAMEAMLIKPVGFDPSKKYPVYQYTYSGPHAPSVRNAWGGPTYLFHQMLAQNGIVVWINDNRTASGKGAVSAWPAYRQLGVTELRDLEDGLTWLKQQPWIDGSKVVLSGWSYGGFMTSYALTNSTMWSAGIAGGSVTDWRLYDSVYTERYMLTPEHNAEGYDKTAPQKKAADLHGNLLLIHGMIDDNVHMQNTIQFAYNLQKAGRQFELMLYPKQRHGVVDPQLVKHMRQLMFDFILRNTR
ncbi:MAG TPA: S9 family peptidase [Thermoanaerobaculia bacterium]|nr:S9 family peptidase [Thermoanaerobaculia bacterium]